MKDICTCSMKTKLVGDGCEHCNPKYALELAKDQIEDLSMELSYAALEKENLLCAIAEQEEKIETIKGWLEEYHEILHTMLDESTDFDEENCPLCYLGDILYEEDVDTE